MLSILFLFFVSYFQSFIYASSVFHPASWSSYAKLVNPFHVAERKDSMIFYGLDKNDDSPRDTQVGDLDNEDLINMDLFRNAEAPKENTLAELMKSMDLSEQEDEESLVFYDFDQKDDSITCDGIVSDLDDEDLLAMGLPPQLNGVSPVNTLVSQSEDEDSLSESEDDESLVFYDVNVDQDGSSDVEAVDLAFEDLVSCDPSLVEQKHNVVEPMEALEMVPWAMLDGLAYVNHWINNPEHFKNDVKLFYYYLYKFYEGKLEADDPGLQFLDKFVASMASFYDDNDELPKKSRFSMLHELGPFFTVISTFNELRDKAKSITALSIRHHWFKLRSGYTLSLKEKGALIGSILFHVFDVASLLGLVLDPFGPFLTGFGFLDLPSELFGDYIVNAVENGYLDSPSELFGDYLSNAVENGYLDRPSEIIGEYLSDAVENGYLDRPSEIIGEYLSNAVENGPSEIIGDYLPNAVENGFLDRPSEIIGDYLSNAVELFF